MRRTFAIAIVAVLGSTSACATEEAADTTVQASPKEGPRITVGSADFTESILLAEIYAQGLEAKGYDVGKRLRIGSREVYFPALRRGDIDLIPEYNGSLLSYLTKQEKVASSDPEKTYDQASTELEGTGVSLLEQADAQDKDGIVVNMQTAERYGLEKVSDLKEHASELVMGGPPECPTRQACLKGLREVYGIEFKEFKPLDVAGPQTVQALKANEIQVANLFTTQSAIPANDFVLLEDDKNIVGSENVVPAVRDEILEEYGEEFRETVNAITATLTTEKLTELNARVDNEREDEADVAAAFLEDEELV